MSLFEDILNQPDRHTALLHAIASERRISLKQELYRSRLQGAIRDFFRTLATGPNKAHVAMPNALSKELADAFEALGEGYVHPLVRPASKKQGQRTFPAVRRCQVDALHYIVRAKRGDIVDTHPVKTVTEHFGITRRLLSHWRKARAHDLAAALAEPCPAPDFIVPRLMRSSAISYRRWRNVDARIPDGADHPTRQVRAIRANRRT